MGSTLNPEPETLKPTPKPDPQTLKFKTLFKNRNPSVKFGKFCGNSVRESLEFEALTGGNVETQPRFDPQSLKSRLTSRLEFRLEFRLVSRNPV